MQRRTFVMFGLSPLALAACGGGGDDNAQAVAGDADPKFATAADGRQAAMGHRTVGYVFTLLPPVDGTESSGIALNNAGQVVGISGAGEAANFGPTLWSRGSSTRFPTLGGIGSGGAQSINNAGQFVGESSVSATISHATLWRGSVPIDLGTLNGAFASGATDINNAGQIVGWSYVAPNPSGSPVPAHATLWSGGTLIDLGTLGGSYSAASSINNAGQIVGWSSADQVTGRHATMWSGGAVIDLGGLGGTQNYAFAINDIGQVVGFSSIAGTDETPRAVLWSGGTLTALGTLGGTSAVARDINNAGQIVGWSALAGDPNGHATLWNGTVATDLNDFLDDATREAGWYLGAAVGINDRGWITGDAFNTITGAREGYLLSVAAHPHR